MIKEIELLKAEQKRLASLGPLYTIGNQDPTLRPIIANQNNYDPGNYDIITLVPTGGSFNVTGLTGGVNGRILFIRISSAFNINFTHADAASSVGNQFTTQTAATVTKTNRLTLMVMYFSPRWVQII